MNPNHQQHLNKPNMSTNKYSFSKISHALLISLTIMAIIIGLSWDFAPVSGAEPLTGDSTDQTDAVVYDVFGVEMQQTYPETGLTPIADAGITMIRYNGVKWSDVEASPGTYDWNALAGLEDQLYYALNEGIDLVIVVRSAPTWARLDQDYACGPIHPNNIKDFANFMNALVSRYKDYIKFWEIWNEPDAPLGSVESDGYSGCWGDPNDSTYYGGDYYSEMLDQVYDAIKAADPDAYVMVGGLMMDCGPNGNCSTANKNRLKFIDGLLAERSGGLGLGKNFDILAFHAFDYYTGGAGNYKNDAWGTSRATTGPVEITKANYLWNKLYEYQIEGKWLVNSELALICDGSSSPGGFCDDNPFEVTKAIYIGHAYSSAIASQLFRAFWYGARMGWRNTDLLTLDYQPKNKITDVLPGPYDAFEFGRSILEGVQDGRQITEYGSDVQGYAFEMPNKYVWVLWWKGTGVNSSIQLPEMPLAIYDVDGDVQTLVTTVNLRSNTEPFYIEFEKPVNLFIPVTVQKFQNFPNGNFDEFNGTTPNYWVYPGGNELSVNLITVDDDTNQIFPNDTEIPLGKGTIQLGDDKFSNTGSQCLGGVPVGNGSVEQELTIPDTGNNLPLKIEFKYILYTQDRNNQNNEYDSLEVHIKEGSNDDLVFWDANFTASPSCTTVQRIPESGWKTGSIDVTSYKGETVTVEFRITNKVDGYYNTASYVDDVHFVYGP